MSSKPILIILSYTVSKFARFFLRHSVEPSLVAKVKITYLLIKHHFYRAMLLRARWCHSKLSVRPSVCPWRLHASRFL